MLTRWSGHDVARRSAETAVQLLRDLVHQRVGLYYPDDRTDTLVEKVSPLAQERGFHSLLDYYYLLKYDGTGQDEWARLADALSVPETYFWREMDQIRAIVDAVVPACVAGLAGEPLRIWSVPCSGGEEPLTLAMLLDEAGWFERAPITIHGSDLSPAAVARARAGVYRERSFRALPDTLRDRYFTRTADGWRVSPALHRRIQWSVVNLMDPGQIAATLAGAPIVLCRNLFIYFSEEAIRRTVAVFAHRMPTPAYLCVGVCESLLRVTTAFELTEIGGALMYVKRATADGA